MLAVPVPSSNSVLVCLNVVFLRVFLGFVFFLSSVCGHLFCLGQFVGARWHLI